MLSENISVQSVSYEVTITCYFENETKIVKYTTDTCILPPIKAKRDILNIQILVFKYENYDN